MADLIEIQKEIDKADLRKSIEIADRSKINKFLTQQPELFAPEILKLVAYYFFDPDRKPLKVGPKPKKKRSFLGIDQIARMYYYLMKHKEVAWCILNRDKEAFELVEDRHYLMRTAILPRNGNIPMRHENERTRHYRTVMT